MLRFIISDHPQLVLVLYVSQATIPIAENLALHECTKRIESNCDFISEKITIGLITPSYLCSRVQLTEIFTKAIKGDVYQLLLCKLDFLTIH